MASASPLVDAPTCGEDLEVDCNVRTLPGTPDVVVPELDLAIFADGCFFHGCPKHGKVPSSNVDYWAPKLARNVQRDHRNRAQLAEMGWEVLVIWECETRDPDEIDRLYWRVRGAACPR